jgi:hypothetical protein
MRAVARRWRWFTVAAVGLLSLFFLLSSLRTIAWVGSKDLEVEFVVSDAGTGQPIPGALVRFYNPHPSGLCGGEYREAQFSRVADGDGRITLFCRECMCSGQQNWHRDTFAIHVPAWYILVSATGYEASELAELDGLRRQSQLQRGVEIARVVFEIKLRRSGS